MEQRNICFTLNLDNRSQNDLNIFYKIRNWQSIFKKGGIEAWKDAG